MLLTLLPQDFSVCKLPLNSPVNLAQEFVFVARTDTELSLVCETAAVPPTALQAKHHWKGLRLSGELDFSLVGILANISGLLAQHHISIFAVSTYLTDYIFVQESTLKKTIQVLCDNGHSVERLEP